MIRDLLMTLSASVSSRDCQQQSLSTREYSQERTDTLRVSFANHKDTAETALPYPPQDLEVINRQLRSRLFRSGDESVSCLIMRVRVGIVRTFKGSNQSLILISPPMLSSNAQVSGTHTSNSSP